MKLCLNPSDMLEQWRLHSGYSLPLADAVCRRNDGIDLDTIMRADLNAWYRRLLAEGEPGQLAPEDFSHSVVLTPGDDGGTIVSLPPEVVRVTEVRLSGWTRPARIVTSPTHILAARQLHPFTRATRSHPVALFVGGTLRLYPASSPGDSLLSLRCVTLREDEYRIDDSAFSSLHP